VAGPPDRDGSFRRDWVKYHGNLKAIAAARGVTIRAVLAAREKLAKVGVYLPTVSERASSNGSNAFGKGSWQVPAAAYKPRQNATIKDGRLFVFSDAHYMPGEPPVAHEALLILAKRLKPKGIIANGDILDGGTISRHDVLGWAKPPTVAEELDTCKTRLAEIDRAVGSACRKWRTIGNHCSRFDRKLATDMPEFAGVEGMRLEDHLRDWPASYTVMLNEDIDPVFVVHNIKGGAHAPYNNVKAAGCTVISGHLHSQKAEPFSNLFRDCEGIDAGMLADKDNHAFAYRMDRPADWRSGFVVMTFDKEGRHYPAEFLRVRWLKKKAQAVFRGEVVYERAL
jgi:hypothetical protein